MWCRRVWPAGVCVCGSVTTSTVSPHLSINRIRGGATLCPCSSPTLPRSRIFGEQHCAQFDYKLNVHHHNLRGALPKQNVIRFRAVLASHPPPPTITNRYYMQANYWENNNEQMKNIEDNKLGRGREGGRGDINQTRQTEGGREGRETREGRAPRKGHKVKNRMQFYNYQFIPHKE